MIIDGPHVIETIAAGLVIWYIRDVATTNRQMAATLSALAERLMRAETRLEDAERLCRARHEES